MKGTVRLQDLYERHRDRVEFLHVYIREAHPSEGWTLGGPVLRHLIPRYAPASTDLPSPTTLGERREAAIASARSAEHQIPTLVDDLDDAVCEAYVALPTRLFLVDEAGRIAYAGGPGPYGFKPAELGRAIEKLLG